MAFNDTMLTALGTHATSLITHFSIHSASSGPGYTTNLVGSRVDVTAAGAVDADGDITWTVNVTGLPANQAVWGVGYWSALTDGTNYGGCARSGGDATANAAGAITLTITETGSAS